MSSGAKQILGMCVCSDGLAFIHSKGLMHRDLKPENILMVSRSSNTEIKVGTDYWCDRLWSGLVQIADFGLARGSAGFPLRLPRSRTICGSDFYLAPEIIRQEEYVLFEEALDLPSDTAGRSTYGH